VPLSACLPHRASMLLPFAGNLRAAIPGLVSMLLHPLATHCELEHQSTLLGIVRLCSRAEALLRLIFIHLSQSTPLNYLVPRCRVQVRHPSDKRAKKFLVCTGSWAAAELTSPRQARAALGAAAGLTLERNTIIGPLGTGRPRGDLFGCVRPKDPLLWCNDGRGRPRCLADPGACSLVR
jgi:hypothetical protein